MRQPREIDRIQCLECRKWYRALPHHLIRTHGMTDEDYRLKFGVPVGVPLVCEEWSNNQRDHNLRRGSAATLTARGPGKGFRQRESVKRRRAKHYARISRLGRTAALKVDKTSGRIAQLSPLPVTIDEAVERLGCSRSAACTFLSYCVRTRRLSRIARGIYGAADA